MYTVGLYCFKYLWIQIRPAFIFDIYEISNTYYTLNLCTFKIFIRTKTDWLTSKSWTHIKFTTYIFLYLRKYIPVKEIQKPNLPETNPDQSDWHVSIVTFETAKTFLRFYFVSFFYFWDSGCIFPRLWGCIFTNWVRCRK